MVELLLYSSSSSQKKKQRYMSTTATDTRKNAVDLDDTSKTLTMLGKGEKGAAAARSEALETQGSRRRR